MIKTMVRTLLLVYCGTAVIFAQETELKISTKDEIKGNVIAVPCKNDERLEGVKELFQNMGAKDSDISIEKFKDIQNVVVTKKGKTDETIVVGAHYDKTKAGCGAIDNWTGIVIISNIYRTLRSAETEKTYKFVAFDKEEDGLLGSEQMVKSIQKEKNAKYCSMINFDSFGFAYPQIMTNTSDPLLIDVAKQVSAELKIPFAQSKIENADADSSSFMKNKIPAITIHGLNNRWQVYLHSSNDKIENINSDSVYVGYRYGVNFVAEIDSRDCHSFKK